MSEKKNFVEKPRAVKTESLALAQPANVPDVKLFGRSYDGVQVTDTSLKDYIAVKEKNAKFADQIFKKAKSPIVESLVNDLMINGEKPMNVNIVKHPFEIINPLTNKNPIQILVTAIIISGPGIDSIPTGRAGISQRQAVDIFPLRRGNQPFVVLRTGDCEAALRNIKTIAECLADKLMNGDKGSSNSYVIKQKEEIEHVPKSHL